MASISMRIAYVSKSNNKFKYAIEGFYIEMPTPEVLSFMDIFITELEMNTRFTQMIIYRKVYLTMSGRLCSFVYCA